MLLRAKAPFEFLSNYKNKMDEIELDSFFLLRGLGKLS